MCGISNMGINKMILLRVISYTSPLPAIRTASMTALYTSLQAMPSTFPPPSLARKRLRTSSADIRPWPELTEPVIDPELPIRAGVTLPVLGSLARRLRKRRKNDNSGTSTKSAAKTRLDVVRWGRRYALNNVRAVGVRVLNV